MMSHRFNATKNVLKMTSNVNAGKNFCSFSIVWGGLATL